jgi:thiamine-phosphate pyrophosphorylase
LPIERKNPIVCYVTDSQGLDGVGRLEALREKIRSVAEAGADWVQIREKELQGKQLLALVCDSIAIARREQRVAGNRRPQIIVNDRLDVAAAAGAAGVHLGRVSLPVAGVRDWRRTGRLPADFWIGASCHSLEEAREAERDGADYILFGPVFETPGKLKFGAPQGVEKLGEVCRRVGIPVIAIGGVSASNWESCLRAGAAGIAAIRMFQKSQESEGLREFIRRLHESPVA